MTGINRHLYDIKQTRGRRLDLFGFICITRPVSGMTIPTITGQAQCCFKIDDLPLNESGMHSCCLLMIILGRWNQFLVTIAFGKDAGVFQVVPN